MENSISEDGLVVVLHNTIISRLQLGVERMGMVQTHDEL